MGKENATVEDLMLHKVSVVFVFPNPLYSDGFSHTDNKIRMGLSILYLKGSQVDIPK